MSSIPRNSGKPLSSNVATGAHSIATGLATITHETRIGLAKLAKRAVDHAIKSKRALPVSSTGDLRQLTASAAQIGGWDDREQTHQTLVNVNILNS